MAPNPSSEQAQIEAVRERLRVAGAGEGEIASAVTLVDLFRLSGEMGNRPEGQRMSLRAVADAAGIPVEVARRFLVSAGLPADDLDAAVWYSSDVAWMRDAHAAQAVFGDDAILALFRRAGGAMSQLTSAASSVFRVNLGANPERELLIPMEVVERNLGTRPLIDTFLLILNQLYRYHSRLSFREDSVAAGSHGELRAMAVGFVDLAASTELGEQLSAAELARVISEFNAAAFDAATRHGARVVKTIGDEVMLCAVDPSAVVRAAMTLVEFCEQHSTFSAARGGVAAGDVLEQDGDCYGPVVNRAARFVEAAPDGAVMADAGVCATLGSDLTATTRPPVEHRGLGSVVWSEITA